MPEFDATLVAYDPRARDRFVAPDHNRVLWSANGLTLPPVLHEGRIVGYWRLEGTGPQRRLEVRCFAGCPQPSVEDVAGPGADVAAGLGVEVVDCGVGVHVE